MILAYREGDNQSRRSRRSPHVAPERLSSDVGALDSNTAERCDRKSLRGGSGIGPMPFKRIMIVAGVVAALAGWLWVLRWIESPVTVLDLGPVSPPAAAPMSAAEAPPSPARSPISGMPRNALAVAQAPRPVGGATLVLTAPSGGAVVTSPVTVQAQLVGMTLAPAGTDDPRTGHLHVVLDSDLPRPGAPITRDAHHIDFGGGEAEGTVELAPGPHTIQVVLGDANHIPHDPPIASARINITVRSAPPTSSGPEAL